MIRVWKCKWWHLSDQTITKVPTEYLFVVWFLTIQISTESSKCTSSYGRSIDSLLSETKSRYINITINTIQCNATQHNTIQYNDPSSVSTSSIYHVYLERELVVRARDCFGTSDWRFSKHLTHNSAEWGTDITKRVRKFYSLLLPTVIQICTHNKKNLKKSRKRQEKHWPKYYFGECHSAHDLHDVVRKLQSTSGDTNPIISTGIMTQ